LLSLAESTFDIPENELNNMFKTALKERNLNQIHNLGAKSRNLNFVRSNPNGVPAPFQANIFASQAGQAKTLMSPVKFNPHSVQQPNLMGSFSKNTPNSMVINNMAETSFQVAKELIKKPDLRGNADPVQQLNGLRVPKKFCPFKMAPSCDFTSPYRTLDGSCNNPQHIWWGQAEMPYKRIVRTQYADGISEPRSSVDGSPLPNPRQIACALHGESHEIEEFITHMFMEWAQIINHDMTSLSINSDEEKDLGTCKDCKKTEKCLPIMIEDAFACNCIKQMAHECIEFTRSSATFADVECTLGRREQLNLQSSFLDGSIMYSTKQADLEKLRDRTRGRGMMRLAQNDLLPQDQTEKPSDCLDFRPNQRCFKGGDDRVNQNPALMSMSTILVREHNRIARILGSMNPQWEDEVVFQETRRVMVAFMQHITFNEYVPILLGQELSALLGLAPGRDSAPSTFRYNINHDPRIGNEWAASAGRFGHSMIRSALSRLDNHYNAAGMTSYYLRNSYFRANHLYDTCQGGMESVIRGLLVDPIMKVDRWFSDDITKHLFETTDDLGRPFNFDLVSINLQRGRDHGIPGYTTFRQFCNLTQITTWQEMKKAIPADVVDIFQSLYKFVDDVDLFSAAVSELKQDGAIVGPTLSCLLGNQFRDIKFGDRFFYETSEQPGAFTPQQLNEIKKVTLSKILCRNMKDTPGIQPFALLSSAIKDNEMVNCTNLPDLNWSFWKN
jgi:peroxidase